MASPFRVLFVCMGNICRSPAGECTLRHLIAEAEEEHLWQIDSAGTIGMHSGNSPDSRMRMAGKNRGLQISGAARQVKRDDLDDFDLILAMDEDNLADLKSLGPEWEETDKLKLFRSFCPEFGEGDVPDPYYGGSDGFELVLDMMEEGCREIIAHARNR